MTKTTIQSIIFLGTGPSSGVPSLYCLSTTKCSICLDPRNRRTCVSILLRTKSKPILVDCSKDFRQQYEIYLAKRAQSEDALPNVLLTHEHADAIMGLNSFKQMIPKDRSVNIFSDKRTINYLESNFKHLFVKGEHAIKKSGDINTNYIKSDESFEVSSVEVFPLYVDHGNEKTMAFLFDKKVLYVSDCSNFDRVIDVEILIIECTTIDTYVYGHINLEDVMEIVRKLNPKKTYLVGMGHLIDCTNKEILKCEFDIEFAYDGMEISLQK